MFKIYNHGLKNIYPDHRTNWFCLISAFLLMKRFNGESFEKQKINSQKPKFLLKVNVHENYGKK